MTGDESPRLTTPPGNISVPPKGEDYIVVMVREWDRLKVRLAEVKRRRRGFSNAAWTGVGLVGGAVLAAAAWWPAFKGLTQAQRYDSMWVWTVIISCLVGSLLLTAFGFIGAHLTEDAIETSVDQILEDMEFMTSGLDAPEKDDAPVTSWSARVLPKWEPRAVVIRDKDGTIRERRIYRDDPDPPTR